MSGAAACCGGDVVEKRQRKSAGSWDAFTSTDTKAGHSCAVSAQAGTVVCEDALRYGVLVTRSDLALPSQWFSASKDRASRI